MKADFDKMSNQELIAYALAHREDMEPLRVLYNRRTPDDEATWYPAPCTAEGVPIPENIKIMEEAIKNRIQKQDKK